MISTASELDLLCERLRSRPRIAIDTEADSLHCYFEKLCLIQISLTDEQVLVDPLAGFSLEPLIESWHEKTLLFHGGDYDLRLLHRFAHFHVAGVFDTMIGAQLLGWQELGLAPIVEKQFGITLSKASQKANWAQRPLSEEMQNYARNDTRYLEPLGEIIEQELKSKNRWDWFTESCERLLVSTQETRTKDADQIWRISGSALLSPHAQAILRSLWFWRDQEARQKDRPPFHIASNAQLLEIARLAAEGKMSTPTHLSGSRKKRFEIALDQGIQTPEKQWPKIIRGQRSPRATQAQKDHLEALRAKRDRQAKELALDPSIIAPRAALEAIAFHSDTSRLMSWQYKLLEEAMEVPSS